VAAVQAAAANLSRRLGGIGAKPAPAKPSDAARARGIAIASDGRRRA
jgi:hypothetical protein